MELPHATHKQVATGWVLVVQRVIDDWVARRYAREAAERDSARFCPALIDGGLNQLSAPH